MRSHRNCKRPGKHEDETLCFCEFPPRQVLGQSFINGWIPETWYAKAKRLHADGSDDECQAYIFELERIANSCYAMWRETL